MFSVRQKREISEAVQKILRATNHPELPAGEIKFRLHVDGAESWSWADIHNNGAVLMPGGGVERETGRGRRWGVADECRLEAHDLCTGCECGCHTDLDKDVERDAYDEEHRGERCSEACGWCGGCS